MEFLNSLIAVKKETKNFEQWDKKWDDKDAQRKALHAKIEVPQDKLEKSIALGKTIIHAVEVMDEKSEENTENVESITEPLTGIFSIAGLYIPPVVSMLLHSKGLIKPKTALISGGVGAIAGFFGALIGSVVYGTHLQKTAARISHYQSQKELENPKKFIVYDKEQIEEAKKIAQSIPNEDEDKKKKEKDKKSFISSIKSLFQDRKKYEEWQKDKHKKYDVSNINATPLELEKAKADQDIIFRVVKNVNEKAEDYSENMETTAGVILGSSFLLGGTIGSAITAVLNKVGIGDKIAKRMANYVEKNSDKPLTIGKFYAEAIAKGMQSAKGRIKTLGIIGASVASIAVIPISLKLQKNSARVGRYLAKKELEENPKNFVYYDENQMLQVKDIKANKKNTLVKRIINDLKFIPKIIKETFEYEKYKKTQLPEKKKFRKALMDVSLKPGQLEEAKNIQVKVFKSFDKIDEMSQRYSEDVEAATNIGMQSLPILGYLTTFSPIVLLAYGVITKKITIGSVAQKLSGLLAKGSFVLKTKRFGNFLKEAGHNVEKMGESLNQTPISETLSAILKKAKKENMIDFLEIIKNAGKNKENMAQFQMFFGSAGVDAKFLEKNTANIQKIAANLQKIIKKLPDKEFENLRNKLADNPNVLISCLSDKDKFKNIFITPTVKNIAKTAAISWAGINITGLTLIQMYLAELQKQSGKIGTMKAIQSLEDPKHFVDMYPNTATEPNTLTEIERQKPINIEAQPQLKKEPINNELLSNAMKILNAK